MSWQDAWLCVLHRSKTHIHGTNFYCKTARQPVVRLFAPYGVDRKAKTLKNSMEKTQGIRCSHASQPIESTGAAFCPYSETDYAQFCSLIENSNTFLQNVLRGCCALNPFCLSLQYTLSKKRRLTQSCLATHHSSQSMARPTNLESLPICDIEDSKQYNQS